MAYKRKVTVRDTTSRDHTPGGSSRQGLTHAAPHHRLGLLTMAAVGAVAATLAQFAEDWIAGRAAVSDVAVHVMVTVVLLVVVLEVALLRRAVVDVGAAPHPSIRYYPAGTPRELDTLYRAAAGVVRGAAVGAEVVAVNSWLEVYASPDRCPSAAASCRRYLQAFEDRFGEVSYRRLVQVDREPAGTLGVSLRDWMDASYLEHYVAMTCRRQGGEDPLVQLTEVGHAIPISFVVVSEGRGGRIIWQLHRNSPQPHQPDAVEMLGVLIIDDPAGQLVPTFMSWFRAIDRGDRRDLTPADLGCPPVSPNGAR
ncbi:hypothetical protein [Actinomycetospora sp. CA-053990]|uniref:hypothetical protein n=1 Tax=Actinomycetospora sp. CA-053990 TaxID=3239891 RepID=UPI003D946705